MPAAGVDLLHQGVEGTPVGGAGGVGKELPERRRGLEAALDLGDPAEHRRQRSGHRVTVPSCVPRPVA